MSFEWRDGPQPCGLCETNKRTAALMLQEREFFAEQIRDIRDAITNDRSECADAVWAILKRRNPLA